MPLLNEFTVLLVPETYHLEKELNLIDAVLRKQGERMVDLCPHVDSLRNDVARANRDERWEVN